MADVLEPEVGWWSAAGAGMAATRDLDKNRDYNEEEENVEEFEVSDTEYGFDDGLQQENIGIGIRVQRQMDGFGPEGVRVNLELESDSDKSDELLSDHDSNSNGLRYSPEQWTPVSDIEPILPPTIRRPSGRPSKKRKREADEVSNPKLTKRGQQANCTKCGKPSHNKRTCRGEIGVNQPIKRPTPSNQPQPPRHPGSHPSSSNQQQPMTPPTIVRLMPNQPSGQQSIVSNPPTQESQASTRD
ncbi:hypothetical protein V6N11_058018 [Hibiscus sabdariffa]|uniref:CCHC-type domain-containing protein n=1 Tax=Hibiscus sabdariffa TaxID=183260 RepID=A0ABR1ZXE3_9ROSI